MHSHTAWGQCARTSGNAPPHCLGAVGTGTPPMHTTLPGGSRQWNSCNAPPHCLWTAGSRTAAMRCHTAWGPWVVELLQCTATLPRGNAQGPPVMHRHTACEQWTGNSWVWCWWGGVGWGGVGCGGGGGGGAPAVVPRTVSRGVVPRGPHAGTAEGVLRLTSARVRRMSSHT